MNSIATAAELVSVGEPDIDLVHEQLANKMKDIIALICSSKDNTEADACLRSVYSIACRHFHEEEKLMIEIKYPFSGVHIKAHNLILDKIVSLIIILSNPIDTTKILAKDLLREIVDHVKFYDVSLFAYVKDMTAGRLGQGASSSLPS